MRKSGSADVISRLKLAIGTKSDSELGTALGVPPQTISSWKSRDSVPYAKCVEVAEERNISLDWLLTGDGPMRRGEPETRVQEAPAAYVISPHERAILELFRSLDEEAQRELQSVAAEKKRLRDMERRLQQLIEAMDGIRKPA